MKISRREFVKKTVAAGAAVAATSLLGSSCKDINAAETGKGKRVIIFAFDGVRVDGLEQANTPNIDALIAAGSASFTTRVQMPSMTLPNFTSHLVGAGPEIHGVVNNDWTRKRHALDAVETDEDGYFPSVYKILHEKGVKTAYYWGWQQLVYPLNQKYFDDKLLLADNNYPALCDKAMEFISANRGEDMFVFLYDCWPDEMGHQHNWMSTEYIQAIEQGDEHVGRVVAFLKEKGLYDDSHLMFITDHGGIHDGHGGVTPEEMIVPWVIAGPGIKKGFTIEEPNNTVNTASTVLKLFGLEQPLVWTGEVPASIFE